MAVDLHYYEVLGVKPEASSGQCLLWLVVAMKLLNEQKAEIKRAYKKKDKVSTMVCIMLTSPPTLHLYRTRITLRPLRISRTFLQRISLRNLPTPTGSSLVFRYETLIDDHKRAHYDRFGRDQGSSGMFEDDMSVDPDELFAHLFGGMGMGPGMFDMGGMGPEPSRGHGRRSQDSIITYEVTLEDLYNGKNVQMNMTRDVICLQCNGSGGRAKATPTKCTRCSGKGWVNVNQMLGRNQVKRSRLLSGTSAQCVDRLVFLDLLAPIVTEKVPKSRKKIGKRTVPETKKGYGGPSPDYLIKTRRPSGAFNFFAACSSFLDVYQPGKETGDLIFVLQLQDHQSFDRHGHSLMTVVNITLSEALTGFNRVLFTHLDGRGIRVYSTDVTRREGMPIPNSSRKGDLYVTFVVDMPDDEWLKALDQIALEALVKLLPPKKPDPPANTVTDVSYTNADTRELQFDDEWEDSDEEEEEEGPQCRHQ
ncbi:dnaJ central domain-containing protein [Rhizoctonia solani AG-1 IA]|uniref:DnaJ central domain-containing protein n=1 Tax=Thanatephorus cucumeris (strain AG1-IA) TaxID=983506 RepID=L8WRJ3_THACA|nr:dnaJ central domain-containing protein [Rhizoctonia solani AG-1 IA]